MPETLGNEAVTGEDYIDINIDNLVDPNAPPKEGEIRFKVIASEKTKSQKGEAMMACQLQVVNHKTDPDSIGKLIFENYMLEGKGRNMGMWGWGQLNKVLGLDGKNPKAPIGMEASAYIIEVPPREGYDRPSARVKEYLKA